MASTYDVIVDTPKYHRQGKVKLELSGDTARAHLDITDVGSLDAKGTRNGKDFDGTMTGYSAGDVVGNDAGFAGRWADV